MGIRLYQITTVINGHTFSWCMRKSRKAALKWSALKLSLRYFLVVGRGRSSKRPYKRIEWSQSSGWMYIHNVCVYINIHLLNTYTILQVHMHTQDFRLVLRCHPRFLLLKPSCVMIASHFVGQISIKVIFCCTHIKPSFFANRKLERNNSIGWSRFIFF